MNGFRKCFPHHDDQERYVTHTDTDSYDMKAVLGIALSFAMTPIAPVSSFQMIEPRLIFLRKALGLIFF